MSYSRTFAFSLLALLALARPSLAHHSFSMYDSEKLVKLEGTIKEFQWTNPHAIVWVTGTITPGQPPELWTVELPTSPGNLTRMGWKRTSLSPGDPVVLEINPLRDGSRGGSFKKATNTSTGAVLVATVRDEPPAAGGAPAHDDDDHAHDHDHEAKDSGCSVQRSGARDDSTALSRLAGPACLVALAARTRRRPRRRGSRERPPRLSASTAGSMNRDQGEAHPAPASDHPEPAR